MVTASGLEENFLGAGELLNEKDMKIFNAVDIRVRVDDASEPTGYWLYRDLEKCVPKQPLNA
jgi:hypothetical protein